MNIRCPHCKTVFRIDPDRIPATGVRARCARCTGTFRIESQSARPPAASGVRPTHGSVPDPDAGENRLQPPVAAPTASGRGAGGADRDAGARQTIPDEQSAPASRGAANTKHAAVDAGSGAGAAATSETAAAMPTDAATGRHESSGSAGGGSGAAADGSAGEGVHTQPGREPSPVGAEQGSPAVVPVATEAPVRARRASFAARDPEARAQRLARALVSDIVAYHPERLEKTLAGGSIRLEFREEIMKSWEEYVAQVGAERAKATPYFRDALNEILARGRKVF
jgi:predicted Zn finger-like uncharacterized protein